MRGTLCKKILEPFYFGIIPAHAGNTVRPCEALSCFRDHPRTCGEHRVEEFNRIVNAGSSPHMRGTRNRRQRMVRLAGIIPAHAGNTYEACRSGSGDGDHPRTCGEHLCPALCGVIGSGSSPHMRGTLQRLKDTSQVTGIIPAHAGNTRTVRCRNARSGDHPRTCGEHIPVSWWSVPPRGSSPHMRGTPGREASEESDRGIIPAHAGNTRY